MSRVARLVFFSFCMVLLCVDHLSASDPRYVENKGQWHDNVLFRVGSQGGIGYVDREGFTLMMLEDAFFSKLHSWVGNNKADNIGNGHTLKMQFLNADLSREPVRGKDVGTSENYFIGNNPEKWATDVRSYDRVKIPEIYQGIDVQFGTNQTYLKYDFIVSPNADPNQIAVRFNGQDKLFLEEGSLIAKTSVGDFVEAEPFAYQMDASGSVIRVACEFVLEKEVLSYHFPDGYDTSLELIIDPEISFSSYIGSSVGSFGFTASYDDDGNLYSGAVVFGQGYPTEAGAFQFNFGQGVVDCGISKFSTDGTELIYSTYLGGQGNESPHSIVVNGNNELFVFGTTSSANFPLSANAYQTTHAGGTNISGAGYSYENGSDIFISKLSFDGSGLLASTLIGGTSNDGLGSGSVLENNYGDQFRGEIVVDDVGNPYVASVTASGNFPIVNGYESNIGGALSGVIFKMSANLEDLIWSTFSGGNFTESAVGLQLAEDNSVYFTGGTTSTILPISAGAYQVDKAGGVDGYIGHISADGSQLLACTYNGTTSFDQNYFVQIDTEGFVYVFGQSLGNYPISNGVYSNPNSGQYIQKFSADLSTSIWSTEVGSGSGGVDISPSAFLVSDCGQIYLSGWGGSLNNGGGSTNVLPTSSNAFQTTTDGEDFYLMVLDENASDLVYGTFFGGDQSAEHVDGGTSRFDKNGTVYQAVCAGCFGNDDFPTQPGVWSEVNGSSACNLAVMKFELSSVNALAQIDAPDIVCPGSTFGLTNQSIGADTFLWDMGDGFTTTDEETTYSFDEPGDYIIKLYAEDSGGCLSPDSVYVTVTVAELPEIEASSPEPICPGESIELLATGTATDWQWEPATGLSATNIANPIFSGNNSQEYTVTGSTACGDDSETVNVIVGSAEITVSDDVDICPGESTQLIATGGVQYQWSPTTGLSASDIANPVASPMEPTTYSVLITSDLGCDITEQVSIGILPPAPELEGQQQYVSCNGDAMLLSVSGASEYSWSPAEGLNFANISNPIAFPLFSTTYTVTGTNSCGTDELEVEVLVQEIAVSISADTLVCYDQAFTVTASGADTYIWQPAENFINRRVNPAQATLESSGVITVTGFDSLGCFATASKFIRLFPRANVRLGNDRIINFGDEVMLESFSIYPIVWEPSPSLSCLNCNYPYANPSDNTTYYATIVSEDGCPESDSVNVWVRGNIYVPNSFTPDGDGLNDIFKAKGVDISEFKMEIFNRWGDLIFTSEDIDHGWDGSNNGDGYYSPPDVYQYRIVAKEHQGDLFELKGHVTLLR